MITNFYDIQILAPTALTFNKNHVTLRCPRTDSRLSAEETVNHDPANDLPYHETVAALLATINRADQAQAVADFIIATACPANHDAIAAFWHEALNRLGFSTDTFGVIAAMETKKVHAARQDKKKLRNQRLATELSKRIMDFFPTNLHGALTVGGGLRFVHEVCQMTRDELLGFMSEEGVAEVEAALANVELGLGMDIGSELMAKLPTRRGL